MEEDKTTIDPEVSVVPKASREPLFGGLLLGFMIFLIIAVLGAIGWGGYRGWRLNEDRANLASIRDLSIEETLPVEEPSQAMNEAPQSESVTPQAESVLETKARDTEIKVLNGGAAKGSAGTLAEVLKKEGYSKVTVGNTLGDYTGTVVYFSSGLEQEAGVVRSVLVKSFPKAELQEALKNNKETIQAPLTIIVGK